MEQKFIRNFSIIAHIDHGKSTLADKILTFTKAVDPRDLKAQMLDDMDLERERGITIKASAVRLEYPAKDGNTYMLNLIDTPGHVDFTYEVSKALAACEGTLILVDASQGVEAQTLANLHLAQEHNLVIIPIINKIDIKNIDISRVEDQIRNILKLEKEKIILASAKEGIGIEEILSEVIERVPAPQGESQHSLKALIFDSSYDSYRGVVVYVRIKDGSVKKGQFIKMMASGKTYEVQSLGVLKPKPEEINELRCGEVGFIIANIKEAREINIGDTITGLKNPADKPLAGYKIVKPLVFASFYPVNSKDFELLRQGMERLRLSDASFTFEAESSSSLGFGFRCGFLGLLHMEIIQERLERESDLNILVTTPTVVHKIKNTSGEIVDVENPSKLPEAVKIKEFQEPWIKAFIMVPQDSIGSIFKLAQDRRGIYKSTQMLDENRLILIYELPLSEVIVDFYDKIKSATKGYGSLDYELIGYRTGSLVKLDVLINDTPCDELSLIVHKEKAYYKGKKLVETLSEHIPRQLFEVNIQAAIGNKIISKARVRPLSKNVTGKCYGGDITRKRKLWEKQKEGKKRMKQFGKVQIPQEAFMSVIKI
ncbi:MAG: translation elongation factor 4 [Candidatus Omnitrophota bacterium]